MMLPALVMIRSPIWPISSMRAAQRRRDRGRRVAPARHLGDVHGQVAAAFEVGDHAQARDDAPQVAGDGSLSGQQVEGALLGVPVLGVDGCVTADDALGEFEICVQQGGGRARDGTGDKSGHFDHRLGQRVQIVVVRVAQDSTLLGYRAGPQAIQSVPAADPLLRERTGGREGERPVARGGADAFR